MKYLTTKYLTKRDIFRHYLNPMKLQGLMRRVGVSRIMARTVAIRYETIYQLIF